MCLPFLKPGYTLLYVRGEFLDVANAVRNTLRRVTPLHHTRMFRQYVLRGVPHVPLVL